MLAFNKALLAKQAWRLLTKPSSLLARVYKAKYYRRSSFLESRSYQTSSYAWRSIIQTQPLIRRGLKWIIGDSQKVRVWEDSWLPEKQKVTKKKLQSLFNQNLMVKDLFISGTHCWDVDKIRSLFQEDDVASILRIRASLTGRPDALRWAFSRSGHYTVKTEYHIQRTMDNENQEAQGNISFSTRINASILTKFWNLRYHQK